MSGSFVECILFPGYLTYMSHGQYDLSAIELLEYCWQHSILPVQYLTGAVVVPDIHEARI